MKSIHFILGIHNHQPVGNFDFVFEEAYSKAYLPFLQILEEHPRIRMMYHTTGPLMDWLEIHHPDFLDRVKQLAGRNQIEIMTGGYYEPILSILPDEDKTGQIQMMNRTINRRFGVKPRGLWVAERVWEPHLPKSLSENGIEFVTVDDYHFLSGGMHPQELLGYYQTDEQGRSLSIFPISMKLRYLIPFSQAEEAVAYLKENADESGQTLLVMCDDGEKFGLWPGTYEWVHEKGWLSRFFHHLEAAMDEGWLKMTTCSEFQAQFSARGRVYLPCASYFEMSEWSLPAVSGARFHQYINQFEEENKLEELKPYLKGGFWRNFLGKYEESNQMYRKALWISNKIAQLEKSGLKSGKKLASARKFLYRAQCNCAYWHGVFGGLYLPHLRHAIYSNLLHAEELINEISRRDKDLKEVEILDFDADGSEEILLRNESVGLVLSPHRGGIITELDFIPGHFNLLNTLRRQPESYHQQVASAGDQITEGASIHDQVRSKEEGLEQFLIYDSHPRSSLVDHFLSCDENPETLQGGKYYELGNFVNQRYDLLKKPKKGGNKIHLSRIGYVVDNEVKVEKSIQLHPGIKGLGISYDVNNLSSIPLNIVFAPEFNFALLAGNSPDFYYLDDVNPDHRTLNATGVSQGVRRFSLFNGADRFAVHFNFNEGTEVWYYSVETVSQSEGGFERVYQSSCVLPVYRLRVAEKGLICFRFALSFELL